jgi:hypothetical protein
MLAMALKRIVILVLPDFPIPKILR